MPGEGTAVTAVPSQVPALRLTVAPAFAGLHRFSTARSGQRDGVEAQHDVKQDVRAVRDVVRWRKLLRRVRDAVDARYEDHAHRAGPREVLLIVSRSAGQRLRG